MIDAKIVADLRAMTGAGIVECKKALEEAGGDMKKAVDVLRKSGAAKAAKKSSERQTAEGVVHAYVHSNEKVGALVELQCETDFVARTQDFKDLAHDIAMQIAATDPVWVSPETIPAGEVEKARASFMAEPDLAKKPEDIRAKIVEGKLGKWYAEVTLTKQLWVKDDSKTIEQLVNEKIATIGEKIVIARFCRFLLSATPSVRE
ncbi:elongation factor Ts [Candidatus Uhrbacteria bacterium RIFCSPHIGHO2_12_FULL_60_25]|uniref:Elongation factor Ts n=1 Tax=Candidatus Uhrbacteria bacterium RIFCSPHIGHO2_12_FULL_60_25 TaxID=1802399 RepID=A0A1F7UMY6_9BACT|nr:MAG: elongation factor Ts [Candidatus Uhrbacteria bacterium RIFCSPHIGHO2_02_FULL_60_44]OGL79656.1 MAG: elongation factor Ts [Candidatus Uhrbacteria bacterium RIFCSPHIGHO2_12_FULL_60_25]